MKKRKTYESKNNNKNPSQIGTSVGVRASTRLLRGYAAITSESAKRETLTRV